MTQVALVSIAVPGSFAGKILGIVAGGAIGEQAGSVGNNVVCVVLAHISVNSGPVDSRLTSTAFEVKDKRGARDEFLITASERADDILWTMVGRVEMLQKWLISKHDTDKFMVILIYRFKVALRPENPLAGRAIVVRLTIVLLQTIIIDEESFTRWTIMMRIVVVILQFTKVVEMIIATLAIWVARTLNPMFFQPSPSWKVLRAIIADVVTRGIRFMSVKS